MRALGRGLAELAHNAGNAVERDFRLGRFWFFNLPVFEPSYRAGCMGFFHQKFFDLVHRLCPDVAAGMLGSDPRV